MASTYPTSLDNFTNPTVSDYLNSTTVPHATQHSDLNDAVENLQAKVGIDSSADTDSIDYKVTDAASRITTLEAGATANAIVAYADLSARTAGNPSPSEGDVSWQEDTNRFDIYDGSTWVQVGGIQRLTSVTFTTSGAVAFASGVFTANYDNYRILLEFVPSVNCTLACQVNVAGVAQTASNYYGNRYDLRAGAVVGSNPGTSHAIMGANASTPSHNSLSIDVFKPTDSGVRTSWHGTWYGANAAFAFDGGVTSAEYNVAAAHDGLTFTPSFGTITGKYTVYGYN
jgi:hypothetical protein